jgi:hypothetical protein
MLDYGYTSRFLSGPFAAIRGSDLHIRRKGVIRLTFRPNQNVIRTFPCADEITFWCGIGERSMNIGNERIMEISP